MTREIALIVAHDRERAIGHAGQLPWHLPDDLRRFKALTLGHTMVMGRKTFTSIGRPLPGRENWVLSRDPSWHAPGVLRLDSWRSALERHENGTLWVIGGGEIYLAALADVTRIELTEVDTRVPDADTFFPPLPADQWELQSREHHVADGRHAFAFDFVSLRRAKSATRRSWREPG
jgi:dihydrofolate reductase